MRFEFLEGVHNFFVMNNDFSQPSLFFQLLRACSFSSIVPCRREDLILTLSLWGLDKPSVRKGMENTLIHASTSAHTHRKKNKCLCLSIAGDVVATP